MGYSVVQWSMPATVTIDRPVEQPRPLRVHRYSTYASRHAIAAVQNDLRAAEAAAEPFVSNNLCRSTTKSANYRSEIPAITHYSNRKLISPSLKVAFTLVTRVKTDDLEIEWISVRANLPWTNRRSEWLVGTVETFFACTAATSTVAYACWQSNSIFCTPVIPSPAICRPNMRRFSATPQRET